jgi:antitoxin MazE
MSRCSLMAIVIVFAFRTGSGPNRPAANVYSSYIHGIRGAIVRTVIRKWGNSLGLRIPKPLAEDAGMEAGCEVDVSVQDGELVIRPIVSRRFRLSDLLEGVTRGNRHGEVESGPPVGREVW